MSDDSDDLFERVEGMPPIIHESDVFVTCFFAVRQLIEAFLGCDAMFC